MYRYILHSLNFDFENAIKLELNNEKLPHTNIYYDDNYQIMCLKVLKDSQKYYEIYDFSYDLSNRNLSLYVFSENGKETITVYLLPNYTLSLE